MSGTWRDTARPIVSDVLRKTAGQTEREIRKALHDAYPFGQREHWPYKVWLDEIARQRKTKQVKPKDHHGRVIVIDKDQMKLL